MDVLAGATPTAALDFNANDDAVATAAKDAADLLKIRRAGRDNVISDAIAFTDAITNLEREWSWLAHLIRRG
jgi:hypothetical protein